MASRRWRRGQSKGALAAAIVIIIIIVAAAAYYISGKGGGQTTTPTSTSPSGTTTSPSPTGTSPQPTTTQGGGAACTAYAKVIETSQAYVVVGPKGACLPSNLPSGKPYIGVAYTVDEQATKPPENSTGFVDIDPAFYRNYTIDALIIAARKATDPFVRSQLYEAVYKLSNYEVPTLWLGQYQLVRVQWSWLHGRYYHPTLAERYDLLWEDQGAPSVDTGIGYSNNASTYVIVTIGWPDTFDPAADYETFGWAIWHNIGDALVTYWKSDTEQVKPDLAVAWAHDANATTWYFVIRGGVKAYDPWHGKTYDISAVDVLFSIWRIARLSLDPSWMITSFVDVNASKVLSEDEFNQILQQGTLTAEYNGQVAQPKSLQDLLSLFGYSGDTAGVVELKLTQPYGAILSILSDPFVSVIPMKYVFEYSDGLGLDKYQQALDASQNGKDPSAWAQFIGTGEQEPTHLLLNQYPVGTGPYYVKDYQKDSYIVLEYNPYYWNSSLWSVSPYGSNGVPSHKTVIYLINNDANARIQILESGTADTGAIPNDRLKDVNGTTYPNTNYKVVVETGELEPTIVYIVLNTM
nr:ABC transporter substrate-binding protein [Desulfurococcales archaeon]